MLLLALGYVLKQKDKRAIKCIVVTYLVAFVVAAVPLVFLFFLKQIKSQQGGHIVLNSLVFTMNIFVDFFRDLAIVIKWSFFSFFDSFFSVCLTAISAIAVGLSFIVIRKNYVRLLMLTNVITWILYWVAVKSNLYSYGDFGGRYNCLLHN